MRKKLAKTENGGCILWSDGSITTCPGDDYIFTPEDPINSEDIEKILLGRSWGGHSWINLKPMYMENK